MKCYFYRLGFQVSRDIKQSALCIYNYRVNTSSNKKYRALKFAIFLKIINILAQFLFYKKAQI